MNVPYQLHLTFFVGSDQTNAFADACAELHGKATIIELPKGYTVHQPMFTKVIHAPDLKAARAEARKYIEN